LICGDTRLCNLGEWDHIMELKELLESLVRALVDHPEDVNVREVKGDKTVILELRVNKDDMGQVIGKEGRTVQAIRTLLNGVATKLGVRVVFEILE